MNQRFSKKGCSVDMDITNLFRVAKQLDQKYYAKVGVLGKSPARCETVKIKGGKNKGRNKKGKAPSLLTNAEIGAKHEFGSISEHIPIRSFLRVPIFQHLPSKLEKVKKFAVLMLKKGNIRKAYERLGIAAEDVVQEAFETGGFGEWAPNSPRTVARKGSSQPLIDTAQLRKSITSEVVGA